MYRTCGNSTHYIAEISYSWSFLHYLKNDCSRSHSLREQTPFSALHVSSFNNVVYRVPQSSLLWTSPFPLVCHWSFSLFKSPLINLLCVWYIYLYVITARSPKVWPLLIYLHSFMLDLIQSEAGWKLSSTSDWLVSAWKNVNKLKAVTLSGSLL